ncbi:uncharacterized protein LOC143921592 [Arctopsyche grandis]|uniref:uncharacterized protein LOC143921592 n=1 Tax=Arctopsyche grandis TaxID=121162 RepID=UPI00406D89EA
MITKWVIFATCVALVICEYAEEEDFSITGLKNLYETRTKNCTKSGYMCDDCNTSSFCILLSDGEYFKEQAEKCAGLQTCLETIGKCTLQENIECDKNIVDYKFECFQPGLFPHPFNCSKYFMCIKENGLLDHTPIELECKNGFGYNPLSTLCNKKEICEKLIQPCKNQFDSGYIQENPSLYYVCLPTDRVYYPQIFVCPFNYEFNGEECVDPTPKNGLENGKCKAIGKFYNPSDCKGYIECTIIDRNPVYKKCVLGLVYDHKTEKCVEFSCWKY